MTITDERLAEIRARIDAANEGPWVQEYEGSSIVHGPDFTVLEAITYFEDAAFAAHARQDVPDLIAEVERLREELAGAADRERRRILGDEDDPTCVLDSYKVKIIQGDDGTRMVYLLCERCPTALMTSRDLDGNQTGLTLAELAQQAMRHEEDEHDDEAQEAVWLESLQEPDWADMEAVNLTAPPSEADLLDEMDAETAEPRRPIVAAPDISTIDEPQRGGL